MIRCELCDAYLPFFQTGYLCPDCYKIRTITKCYNSKLILEHLQKHFLIETTKNGSFQKMKTIEEIVEEPDEEIRSLSDSVLKELKSKNGNKKKI